MAKSKRSHETNCRKLGETMENTNNIIINSRLIKDGQGLAHKAIAVSVESMKRLDNDNKKEKINQINNIGLSQDTENQIVQGDKSNFVKTDSILPEPVMEKINVELTPSFNIPELKEPVEPTAENEQTNQDNLAFIPKIEEPLYQPVNNDTINIIMPTDNNTQNTVLNPFDIAENNLYKESAKTNNGMLNMPQNNMVNEVKPGIISDTTGFLSEENNGNNLEQTQIMPQFIQPPVESVETKPVQIEQISPVAGSVNELMQNNNEESIDLEEKLDSILKRSKALEDATRNLSEDIEIVRKIMESDKIRKNEFFSSLENNTYSQDDNHSISL